jgi:hypothetical protein
MSEDGLFYEGDPFDDPRWKEAEKTSKKAKKKHQVLDFVGCPMAWLEQVLPHVRGEHQIVVALLLYRRWVLCGRRRTFDFPNGDLKKLGINRSTKRKALTKLEQAGLVAVEYLHGHAVRATRRWR